MPAGLVVLAVVLAAATAFGLWRRRTDGRIRGGRPTDLLTAADLGAPLGERATLVHFSTAFCAPCRATRRILSDAAHLVDGVAHIEIDAESRLDLVRRVNVTRTPTTLVLDRDGVVRRRATGTPTMPVVLSALAALEQGEPVRRLSQHPDSL